MRRLGFVIAKHGGFLRSGGAVGSDEAFHRGSKTAKVDNEVNSRIYLAWNGMGGHIAEEGSEYVDASCLPSREEALALALEARGSFVGLGRGGVSLHGRNPYQILGDELDDPADLVLLYAKPVNNGVKGGTNTAYKIAVKNEVPVLNLYNPEDVAKAQNIMTSSTIDDLIIFAQELQREQYPRRQISS